MKIIKYCIFIAFLAATTIAISEKASAFCLVPGQTCFQENYITTAPICNQYEACLTFNWICVKNIDGNLVYKENGINSRIGSNGTTFCETGNQCTAKCWDLAAEGVNSCEQLYNSPQCSNYNEQGTCEYNGGTWCNGAGNCPDQCDQKLQMSCSEYTAQCSVSGEKTDAQECTESGNYWCGAEGSCGGTCQPNGQACTNYRTQNSCNSSGSADPYCTIRARYKYLEPGQTDWGPTVWTQWDQSTDWSAQIPVGSKIRVSGVIENENYPEQKVRFDWINPGTIEAIANQDGFYKESDNTPEDNFISEQQVKLPGSYVPTSTDKVKGLVEIKGFVNAPNATGPACTVNFKYRVLPQKPQVTMTAPASVYATTNIRLSWDVKAVRSCGITNAQGQRIHTFDGDVSSGNASGFKDVPAGTNTTPQYYTIACTPFHAQYDGTVNKTVKVDVVADAKVDVTLNGGNNNLTITQGQNAVLAWSSQYSNACRWDASAPGISAGPTTTSGNIPLTDILKTTAPGTYNYKLTCDSSSTNKPTSDALSITLKALDPNIDIKIEVVENGKKVFSDGPKVQVKANENFRLSWVSQNINECTWTRTGTGTLQNTKVTQTSPFTFTAKQNAGVAANYGIACTSLNQGGAQVEDFITVYTYKYCAEDINEDYMVETSDYTVLVANFFKSGAALTNARANIDGQGLVDASDYNLLVRKFFQGCTVSNY